MQASDFFALEEETRRRILGDEDACRQYLPSDDRQKRICPGCGKEFTLPPSRDNRYKMCEKCRRDPSKKKKKVCAVCGDESVRSFPVSDDKPYYCPEDACRRARVAAWERKHKGRKATQRVKFEFG